MTINLYIKNQNIYPRQPCENIIADSINYLRVHFEFSDEWRDKQKTAIFTNGTDTYTILLIDDVVAVPHEIIKSPSFFISVYGIKDDIRITADFYKIKVFESGYKEGQTPKEPTPDVYSQIINMIEDIKISKGENGEKGEPGKNGLSAYEIAQSNGFAGTQEEWLISLIGKDGTNGKDGTDGKDGSDITSIDDNTTSAEKTWSSQYINSELDVIQSNTNDSLQGMQSSINGIAEYMRSKLSNVLVWKPIFDITTDGGSAIRQWHNIKLEPGEYIVRVQLSQPSGSTSGNQMFDFKTASSETDNAGTSLYTLSLYKGNLEPNLDTFCAFTLSESIEYLFIYLNNTVTKAGTNIKVSILINAGE